MKRYVILMLAGLAAGCGGPTKPSAVEFRVPVKVKEVTTGPVEIVWWPREPCGPPSRPPWQWKLPDP